MPYFGDIRLGDTIDIKFCTVTTTGAPTQLAGSPVISAYPGNSTTQLTAGITLSVDFDSVTGLNNVRVVASNGNGYATATNYALVITTGTVGGTSVVGYCIGDFSIENRSAVMPTTAARTLDISAGGEAGVDWANVGSPTTSLALTGTTIATTQQVDLNTIKTQTVTAASAVTVNANLGTTQPVNFTGTGASALAKSDMVDVAGAAVSTTSAQIGVNVVNINAQTATAAAGVTFPATIASTTNITAGTITTVTNLTNAASNGDFTSTMKTSIGTAVAASAVASVTGNVGGNVVGSVGSVVGAVGSVTGNVGGNVTGSVGSVVGAVGSVTGAVGSVTGNVGGNVVGSVASVVAGVTVTTNNDKTGYRLSATGVDDIWDEVMEGVYTARQYMRLFASVLGSICSGMATSTGIFRDTANTKNRVTASQDASGNRSAVTLDLS